MTYDMGEEKINEVLTNFEEKLKEAVKKRDEKPWIIVFSHYPIYY